MSNFENILQFSHFSIALDMSRITHFLAEIIEPKNSASGNFLTFFLSVDEKIKIIKHYYRLTSIKFWYGLNVKKTNGAIILKKILKNATMICFL